jgi:hypothetical protein
LGAYDRPLAALPVECVFDLHRAAALFEAELHLRGRVVSVDGYLLHFPVHYRKVQAGDTTQVFVDARSYGVLVCRLLLAPSYKGEKENHGAGPKSSVHANVLILGGFHTSCENFSMVAEPAPVRVEPDAILP